MIFDHWTYNQFYMERTSWSAEQKAPIHFTKEEMEWAIEQTEYKYFGYYEFSDQQEMAVEILVWVVKESLKEKPVVVEYEKYEGRDIVISKDNDSEMMGIEIDQKTAFYGNYWDFNVTSLEKLLRDIQKVNPDVKVTVCKATIEDDE